MVALNTVRQCQRKPAEYSNTSLTSTITSSSRSITPESSTPRTPYPKVHLNPPPRPHSFVTAEGYIIEEFPQSRSISEPSRPKHRRFHSTPNASSPGQSNYIETHKSRHSIATRGHSARCSSPLASPPLSPVLITNDPIPNVADPTPCPNSSELLPTSPAPIWPASPRRSVHVTRNLKLKKPRPKRTIEDEPLRPSFGECFRSLFTSKAKQKHQEGRPTPNTLLINRHYTAKFIPPSPAGIRFSNLAIS